MAKWWKRLKSGGPVTKLSSPTQSLSELFRTSPGVSHEYLGTLLFVIYV